MKRRSSIVITDFQSRLYREAIIYGLKTALSTRLRCIFIKRALEGDVVGQSTKTTRLLLRHANSRRKNLVGGRLRFYNNFMINRDFKRYSDARVAIPWKADDRRATKCE